MKKIFIIVNIFTGEIVAIFKRKRECKRIHSKYFDKEKYIWSEIRI